MQRDAIKKAVGYKAAEFVKEGMLIGLGTGSTSHFFIERLIQRHKEGLRFQAVASSERSFEEAKKGGLFLLDPDQVSFLDLTVDGADEIDRQKRMIKGGGGALVREKIIASMSREMIVIIDETKIVDSLGKCKLPIEVIPFGKNATMRHIERAGYTGSFRQTPEGRLFITDNGNVIVDIHLPFPCDVPEKHHETLICIPGVVDTGFFFNLAGKVITGFNDGQIVITEEI